MKRIPTLILFVLLMITHATSIVAAEPVTKRHPLLGVSGKLHEFATRDTGVLVTGVYPGSAAERLRIEGVSDSDQQFFRLVPNEDVIVSFAGQDIKNFYQLRTLLESIRRSGAPSTPTQIVVTTKADDDRKTFIVDIGAK